MNTTVIKTQAELELLIKDGVIEIDGNLEIECSIYGLNSRLSISGNICARDISARDIRASGNICAHDISARGYISASGNISASDISARDICARDISARGNICASGYISAHDISASDISASGNISASDISARDISARGNISARDISASDIFVLSFYAIEAFKIECSFILPLSGNGDRKQWGDRFGFDTSKGCYDEFKENLQANAKRLLRSKKWLPIEIQMLEAAAGKYKKISE